MNSDIKQYYQTQLMDIEYRIDCANEHGAIPGELEELYREQEDIQFRMDNDS